MIEPRLSSLPSFEHDSLPASSPAASVVERADWRGGLPISVGSLIALRELRASDATSLFQALTTEEVARFISSPPSTVQGFERFIAWTLRRRAAGDHACFAVVPRGADVAIGLFQVRSLDAAFESAEWGFAIASEYWGSGVFLDGARQVVDFAFGTLGVRRLEARAAVPNGRGNGALLKLGAVREAVLRQSFRRRAGRLDQALWTILAEDWMAHRPRPTGRMIH